MITATQHGRPYVDELVKNRLYVAAGGNGAAAKSSNEIGRLGVQCVLGHSLGDKHLGLEFRRPFKSVGMGQDGTLEAGKIDDWLKENWRKSLGVDNR